MKKNFRKIGFVALVLAAASFTFVSCNKKAEKEQVEESDSIVVVEEIPTTKDYGVFTYEQKDEVITDAKAELDAINKKIDELKAEVADKQKELSAETKAAYENAIKDLEKTRDDYKAKVDALEKSTADTWEAAKTDIANTYNAAAQSVENTYNNAKSAVTDAVQDTKDALNAGVDSVQKKLLK